jgi:hypothetical protein
MVAQLCLRALGPLSVASYDSQGLRWRYSNPPPHGQVNLTRQLSRQVILRPTVSRPVRLDVGPPLEQMTRFWCYLFFWQLLSSSCKVKVKVILRLTVSRPVRPGVKHPSGIRDQFFSFSLWLFFRQFLVCWCGAPSLTRSRVCSFQFLPVIVSTAFLRSESHGTHELILLSLFWRLPQPEIALSRYIIPARTAQKTSLLSSHVLSLWRENSECTEQFYSNMCFTVALMQLLTICPVLALSNVPQYAEEQY